MILCVCVYVCENWQAHYKTYIKIHKIYNNLNNFEEEEIWGTYTTILLPLYYHYTTYTTIILPLWH